jgi:hypothetical protein
MLISVKSTADQNIVHENNSQQLLTIITSSVVNKGSRKKYLPLLTNSSQRPIATAIWKKREKDSARMKINLNSEQLCGTMGLPAVE